MTLAADGVLRGRLRAATAAAHHALECDLDWETRITTLGGYRDLLAGFYGFHAGYEPAIGQALGDEDFFGPRRRLHRLEADLLALGLDRAGLGALTIKAPPALCSPASAFGALYVLEGSTLGGRVIRRALETRYGAGIADACAYYRGHGRASAACWTSFCDALERRCADPVSAQRAIEAGVATFEALRDWLAPRADAEAA